MKVKEVNKHQRLIKQVKEAESRELKTFIEFYLGTMSCQTLQEMCYIIINEIIKWEKEAK